MWLWSRPKKIVFNCFCCITELYFAQWVQKHKNMTHWLFCKWSHLQIIEGSAIFIICSLFLWDRIWKRKETHFVWYFAPSKDTLLDSYMKNVWYISSVLTRLCVLNQCHVGRISHNHFQCIYSGRTLCLESPYLPIHLHHICRKVPKHNVSTMGMARVHFLPLCKNYTTVVNISPSCCLLFCSPSSLMEVNSFCLCLFGALMYCPSASQSSEHVF